MSSLAGQVGGSVASPRQRRKRSADLALLSGGEMDEPHVMRLTSTRAPGAARRTAERILLKHGRVDVRALGAALPGAVALAATMVDDSNGRLVAHTRTYSAPKGPKKKGGTHKGSGVDFVANHERARAPATTDSAQGDLGERARVSPDDMQYVSGISIVVKPNP